ncbi:MAG TPA: GNAT family N-acetyltransferase [Burkholderiales bacterium]|nr:GNAT family N-acetyltransferase [Burkholderiales bacterium]
MTFPHELTARAAETCDAEAAVVVLRRSIVELCVADHQNDPATLAKWLENKTVEHFHAWLASDRNRCVVTECGGTLNGVGMMGRNGEILLCYVLPEAQGQGFGNAIIRALEEQAGAWGVQKLRLASTTRARPFYEKHGYVFAGDHRACGIGLASCYPYEKTLHARVT